MKLSRNAKLLLLALIGVPVLAVALGLIFRGEYLTEQTAKLSFTLDEDFTKVRKILVRTDGAKQIITMAGDSEFVSQKWSQIGLDPNLKSENGSPAEVESDMPVAEGLLQLMLKPNWRIDLRGILQVRSLDEYIGKPLVELKQEVTIEPDFLNSEVDLLKPTERLKAYKMTTRFERDPADKGSRIELSLTQQILTDAPWFAHGIADRRVRASAARALENQERAIRKLIADNIDDVPLLPLR